MRYAFYRLIVARQGESVRFKASLACAVFLLAEAACSPSPNTNEAEVSAGPALPVIVLDCKMTDTEFPRLQLERAFVARFDETAQTLFFWNEKNREWSYWIYPDAALSIRDDMIIMQGTTDRSMRTLRFDRLGGGVTDETIFDGKPSSNFAGTCTAEEEKVAPPIDPAERKF